MAAWDDGTVVDRFSWKADIAKATTTEIYDSSDSINIKKLPIGRSAYWRVSMTGGGGKLATSATNYPIMLVLTEYSAATSPQGFKRYWPFPGTLGKAYSHCYIPLMSPGYGAGDGAAFKFEVATSTAGTHDHSVANGNNGELQAELVIGDHREEELYTIQHQIGSTSYATNDVISDMYFRRASHGSFFYSTSDGTVGIRVRSFSHRALGGTANEAVSTITTATTTTTANAAWTSGWYQLCTAQFYCSATVTSGNLNFIGMVKGY